MFKVSKLNTFRHWPLKRLHFLQKLLAADQRIHSEEGGERFDSSCDDCVRVCVCVRRLRRPLSGASSQDELQSFGLQPDVVDGGHLPALQTAVEELQFVGFLHDLKAQSSRFSQSCRGVRACARAPTCWAAAVAVTFCLRHSGTAVFHSLSCRAWRDKTVSSPAKRSFWKSRTAFVSNLHEQQLAAQERGAEISSSSEFSLQLAEPLQVSEGQTGGERLKKCLRIFLRF